MSSKFFCFLIVIFAAFGMSACQGPGEPSGAADDSEDSGGGGTEGDGGPGGDSGDGDIAGNGWTAGTGGSNLGDCGDETCNSAGPRFPVGGTPDFTRTSDTEPVVTDSLTGLTWQGCAAGLSGSACDTGTAESRNWSEALSYCWNLSWGGFDDWYLPDEYELQSIVDYRVYGPAIDEIAFPATSTAHFWTSSSRTHDASEAWYVNFDNGYVNYRDGDTGGKGSAYKARCVRRGTTPPLVVERFMVSGTSDEPCVKDNVTGLIWQGCPAILTGGTCAAGTEYGMNWATALEYCEGANWAGVEDWYLPNAKELRSIVDNRRYNPAIDETAFPGTPATEYWASSPFASTASYGWCVDFHDGKVESRGGNKTCHGRCVRR